MIKILLVSTLITASQCWASYRTAQSQLQRRNFMAAAPEFYKVYTSPSSRSERINAEYGLAQSLNGVGLLAAASYYYSLIVRKGPRNPWFGKSLQALGNIDRKASLGIAHAKQLFRQDLNPSFVPSGARGFYFYYQGVDDFKKGRRIKASENFSRVSSSSKYFSKAKFFLGVIANLEGNHTRAVSLFETAKQQGSRELRTQANLNIARVYYEQKKYRKAFKHYSMVSRKSAAWLDSIFESAWAFFILKKHNNTLGNIHTIHSPFYEDRFYPEAYILQSITFLRLCMIKQASKSLSAFKTKYKPVNLGLKALLNEYRGRPSAFFRVVDKFYDGSVDRYRRVWSIMDSLVRTDVFEGAKKIIRLSDRELQRLSNAPRSWQAVGLYDELERFLKRKKSAAIAAGGKSLLSEARVFRKYLKKLDDQTDYIKVEINLGKLNSLRNALNIKNSSSKSTNFIGGLQELKVGQDLEYWPFQGEYWEDELGGYVYNLESKCVS